MIASSETQAIFQLVTVAGAAGALFWVLRLVVDGRLHTSSEVDGLREDKSELLKVNGDLQKALTDQNEQLERLVDILRGGTPRGT